MSARLTELAFEAYDLGVELAAEDIQGYAARIYFHGPVDLLRSVADELDFAFDRAWARAEERARRLEFARVLADAIPPSRRFLDEYLAAKQASSTDEAIGERSER